MASVIGFWCLSGLNFPCDFYEFIYDACIGPNSLWFHLCYRKKMITCFPEGIQISLDEWQLLLYPQIDVWTPKNVQDSKSKWLFIQLREYQSFSSPIKTETEAQCCTLKLEKTQMILYISARKKTGWAAIIFAWQDFQSLGNSDFTYFSWAFLFYIFISLKKS